MAILPIVEVPDPVLSTRAVEVDAFTPDVRQLIDDMAETMYAAPGVGLAAPQVGRGIRVIVADLDLSTPDDQRNDECESRRALYAVVNPEIVLREGACLFEEGCLSVPEFTLDVERSEHIVVRGLDRDGNPQEIEALGFPSVVLQHEIDHLDGVTLIDRVSGLKRRLYLKKQKKKKQADAAADSAS
jgi:peptide deformylase